ncbi:MAG: RraA family protein [Lacrimispora sp.]
MKFNSREEIIELTKLWHGDRFPDGRPKVPEEHLKEIAGMTIEELWVPLFAHGYSFQFEGSFARLHKGKKLVGRALTSTFVPKRPDLAALVFDRAHKLGYHGNCNQWAVDSMEEHDVLVSDVFDKIYNGTLLGGNLTTAIASRTKNGGAVIWGGIRDLEQMSKMEVPVYYRGTDPSPIRDCLISDLNGPCRIGNAICLPGDVVLGTETGVLFIPCHMTEFLIERAYKSRARDLFGFEMIKRGKYQTFQIDDTIWPPAILEDMIEYLSVQKEHPEYMNLNWDMELAAAQGNEEAVKEMLRYHLV